MLYESRKISRRVIPATDTHFSVPFVTNPINAVLLLHMDGPDASTNFVDSTNRHIMTANGAAQIDTAQSVFGNASGLFGGADWLSVDTASDFAFGLGDFTVDCRVRFSALANQQNFLDFRGDPPGVEGIVLLKTNATNVLALFAAGANQIVGTTTLVADTWYHVAATRFSGNTELFLNGQQEGATYADTNVYGSGAGNGLIKIGASFGGGAGLTGWLDEVRIINGTAVWTASGFTVPTAAYSPP